MTNQILSKTAKGLRAVMSGCKGMHKLQKEFLLAVDGFSTAAEVRRNMTTIDDAEFSRIEQLLMESGYLRTWLQPGSTFDTAMSVHPAPLFFPDDHQSLDFTKQPSTEGKHCQSGG